MYIKIAMGIMSFEGELCLFKNIMAFEKAFKEHNPQIPEKFVDEDWQFEVDFLENI